MDPTTNPIPTPTPEPNPTPMPNPGPAPIVNNPVPGGESPVSPVAPEAPVAPAAPVPPVPPVAPEAPAAPVNPVINPASTSPFVQQNGVAATDPIMMPEPAKAPDPIEEELKAPMKAAAPAPGSIGSAVSGPADAAPVDPNAPANNPFANTTNTPSVAFNDPATASDTTAAPTAPKKKTNKNTLIALVVVAVMVVIALAAVLVMQLMSGQPNPPAPSGGNSEINNSTVTQPEDTEETEESSTGDAANTPENNYDLSCTNSVSYAEGGTTYAAGVASAETVYNYTFAGGNLTSVSIRQTITHTDGTADTSSSTMSVDDYRARAGFTPEDVLTIDAVTHNFETNINNFVTDTTVNSSDITMATNSCTEL